MRPKLNHAVINFTVFVRKLGQKREGGREKLTEKQRDGGENERRGSLVFLLVSWNGTNAKLNFSITGHSLLYCVTGSNSDMQYSS